MRINGSEIPFYSKLITLPDIKVITFNYTSFLDDSFQSTTNNSLYFHGYLKEYIRLDNRDFLRIENDQLSDSLAFFKENISNVINIQEKRYLIPGIIPPLKLKPVLSQKFIERWHKTNENIKKSEKIIVIGYSFAYADEHFNDLLRKNADKKIFVVNPDLKNMKKQISRLFGKDESAFTKGKYKPINGSLSH